MDKKSRFIGVPCQQCEERIEQSAELLWQVDQYKALFERLGIDWKPAPWKTDREIN